jgi:hypothetical protein
MRLPPQFKSRPSQRDLRPSHHSGPCLEGSTYDFRDYGCIDINNDQDDTEQAGYLRVIVSLEAAPSFVAD